MLASAAVVGGDLARMSPVTSNRPRWRLRRVDDDAVRGLARAHAISEVTARLLVARGIAEPEAARAHLEPRLSALHDPALLAGMRHATERIARALVKGETICVHGDYDVDGVTGTALLVRLLRTLGARAVWHIPNRFTDGYSFGAHSVEAAKRHGATLVISVDNGTSARATIAELAEHGIDTVVTDHHEPPRGDLPPAVAILNPKLAGSTYPFRELCGGAVAFKLAWGLAQEVSGAARVRDDLREFLVEAMAYVAIATVCDVVPLVDENRVLARYGLRSLAATRNPGLRALLAVSKLDPASLEAEDVAFRVGPRINASGRLGSAAKAVELLLAEDDGSATRLAAELDALNQERKRIELDLLEAALRAAEPYADRERWPVVVVAAEGWHQGVVGIVAARLAQRFERPALVVGLDGGVGRGSARSVPGFSVLAALEGGAEHMLRFGGHAQAAGCEVRAERVDLLREAVCARASELLGAQGFAERELAVDADVPFSAVSPALMRELDRLRPFGERNEKPVLHSADLRLAEPARTIGADGSHLAVELRQGAQVLRAVAFGMGSRAGELRMGEPVHALYTPRWNTFRGDARLELELADFCCGGRPEL